MKKSYILSASVMILSLAAGAAYAQSTGTETFEKEVIVVKGTRNIAGLKKESGAKTKVIIGQEIISKTTAGQTIADTLNSVPGYNFTNNDAYGSSGGNVRMRGMDGSRISLTLDGVQLNDTGNYAIYTNQQLEPELICQASVSTGATDVDSMTASAVGGTVNMVTCKPEDKMGGVVKISGGDYGFVNGFVRLDSGKFGPFGTKAFVAYTDQKYDTWQRDNIAPGELKKQQFNAFIYQDLPNDSYVSMALHFNKNRNRSIYNQTAAQLFGTPTATSGYDWNGSTPGNINPSDTGNVRIKGLFNITDKLKLTVDPTFQYTLANGGGTSSTSEGDSRLCGVNYTATVGGCGVDLNKDGNLTYVDANNKTQYDTAYIYFPSNTNTYRYSLNTSAIYKFNDDQLVRVSGSWDRGRHRQTGEGSYLQADGYTPIDVFSAKGNDSVGVYSQDGKLLQKRNRLSHANVDVYSAEYRGNFLENKLTVNLGLRSQKMTRELNQFCYTLSGGSQSYLCTTEKPLTTTPTTQSDVSVVTFASQGSSKKYFTPYQRTYEVSKTLPSVGATWRFDDNNQVYASYGESLSSPKTDSYYDVSLVNNTMTPSLPQPETSKNAEVGYRYGSPKIYATASIFYAEDANRIVSAYDDVNGFYVDRNVGKVKREGFETLLSYKVLDNLSLRGTYSYTSAELQDDLTVKLGKIPTKGKQLAETPKDMATLGISYDFASQLHFDLNGKYVGKRFTTDVNDDSVDAYTVWNGSVRYDLTGLKTGSYLQLNVINLFDSKYVGSISSKNNAKNVMNGTTVVSSGAAPGLYAAAPRTFVVSLRTAF